MCKDPSCQRFEEKKKKKAARRWRRRALPAKKAKAIKGAASLALWAQLSVTLGESNPSLLPRKMARL